MDRSADAPGISRGLILLMAIGCGVTVANLYYAQPLLPTISHAFGITEGAAGLLVTITQIGYAAGLVLIVPLGDLLDRRHLIVRLLGVCALGLVAASLAPAFSLLAIALGITAVTSVVVQILIPFASTLAAPEERGRVVGAVMSGLLTGVLLARTAAGLIADAAGWRAPFVVAAVAIVALALALWHALPRVAPPSTLPYRRLLLSIAHLVRDEPVLRRRMVYGSTGFAAFSIVWTAVGFLLAGAPYHYSQGTIGLFGLAGAVGAVGAQGFGHLADRGWGRAATGAMLAAILAGWGILALGTSSIVAVIVGLVVLDFGVQGQNVLSQGAIYALGAQHASRVTAAYITNNFVGGSIGSALCAWAWTADGWAGVCILGVVFAAGGFGFWLTELRRAPARVAAEVEPG